MSRYITPDRYRSMGFGADLDDVEDVELAMLIARASSVVNTYCAAPKIPQEHHFAGGSIIREQHRWPFGTETTHGTRRLYTYHRPIKDVSTFRIRVTNTMEVTVTGADIFINNSEGYIELISLAAVSFGIMPVGVLPNLGLYTPVAEVDYTYGYEFSAVGEPLYETDGQVYRGTNGFWQADSVTIYDGGVAVASGGYVLDLEDGSVQFTTQPTGSVTADYIYTMPNEVAMATGEIVADQLSERALTARGMRRLAGVKMAEIELRRSLRGTSVSADLASIIPETAALLLDPYRFRTIK